MQPRTTIGRMTERVTILRPVEAADGAGGEVRSFAEVGTVWAQVLPSGGGPEALGEGLAGVEGYRITVRFRRDLTISHRVRWREKLMNVLAADDETGLRRFTVIRTDAGVVTG